MIQGCANEAHTDRLPAYPGPKKHDCTIVRRFDYDSRPPESAKTLKRAFIDICFQVGATAKAIVAIGRHLLTVRALLDHGQFVQWVEAECVFSLRSAENYMRVARFVDEKNANFANLPPAALYLISAKNAPPELVSEVLALSATSAVIYHADVLQRFKNHKSRKQETDNKQYEVNTGNAVSEASGDLVKRAFHDNEQNKIANANAQIILNRFGAEGVRFLLAIRDTLMETLAVLEQEIGNVDGMQKGDQP